MRAAVVVCVMLAAFGLFPTAILAQPTITIYTDHETYQSGETIQVSLSAQNDDEAMSVAVYVGLILPGGDIWSTQYDGWSHSIEPWIPDIYVPAWFEMARTPFWIFDLPCELPPIDEAGDYSFAALLTYPGTFTYVSMASLAPFTYDDSGPSTDITMISIPGGSFLMGSPNDKEGRAGGEGPQRTVHISPFGMSETEVTEKQWENVMGWNDSLPKRGNNYPVDNVTWFDCVSFCNKLSEADGSTKCYTMTDMLYDGNHIGWAKVTCDFEANGYRLPTEAEWEYVCRAGTTTRFYTGDSDSDLDRAGWYYDNSGSQKREVGRKQASRFGAYDMHGNVWEWCWDYYSADYYETRPNPDFDPTGPSNGGDRVSRGGCWYGGASSCCSAYRGHCWPSNRSFLGLRIVDSVK